MSLVYVVICHDSLMICFRYFLLKESPIHGWFWCSSSRGSHLSLILHSFSCCFDLIQVASREKEDPTTFFPNSRWLWHASNVRSISRSRPVYSKKTCAPWVCFLSRCPNTCQRSRVLWPHYMRVASNPAGRRFGRFRPSAATHSSKCMATRLHTVFSLSDSIEIIKIW